METQAKSTIIDDLFEQYFVENFQLQIIQKVSCQNGSPQLKLYIKFEAIEKKVLHFLSKWQNAEQICGQRFIIFFCF